jgi:hypothetical protein
MDGKAIALSSSSTMRDDGVRSDEAKNFVRDSNDGVLTTTFEPWNALSKKMEVLTTR